MTNNNLFKKIMKNTVPYIFAICFGLLFTKYIYQIGIVQGDSMFPNLRDGNIVIINKFDRNFNIGDIIVIDRGDNYIIKRIVAKENDKVVIENGKLYVNSKESIYNNEEIKYYGYFSQVKLYNDKFYCMGDNRNNSEDSRDIGPIDKNDIIGKVVFRNTDY